MKGNNTLTLCKAQMMKTVETYLNEHVFTGDNSVMVSDITQHMNYASSFEIKLSDPEDSAERGQA